ncbi:unnamed protein product [Brachionus calyciflorus]|uniref:FLYWCH-type domain-containing protein n=1 Tax=Brachionus calyciflorus TaxID=104777 RepID=A0A814GMU7_9BILA|nr:unnamed protein product [Brachionus calyciflorus]
MNPLDELSTNFQQLTLSLGFVTLSQKMAPQLAHEGYFYRVNGKPNNGVFKWRCARTDLKCKGSCSTKGNTIGSNYEVTLINANHNHASNPTLLTNKERRRKIKEKATYSESKTRKILSQLCEELNSKEEIANSPSYEADRQVINRIKRKNKPEYPPQPEKLSDISLPEWLIFSLKTPAGSEVFLLHDSGKDDEERFFVFGTNEHIKLLENAHIFCDGTFDIAPKLFLQVYSIHALVHGRYSDDEKIRKLLKLPQVLAFVPSDDVMELFCELKKDISDTQVIDFYTYFEKTYVGYTIETTTWRRYKKTIVEHVKPMFEINLWNVYKRVKECIPRSNNFVEAWHNAFSSLLDHHPLIYELIDVLRKEQKTSEMNLVKLKTGIHYKRKPKYITLDERIQVIVDNYNKSKFQEFFDSLSSILYY